MDMSVVRSLIFVVWLATLLLVERAKPRRPTSVTTSKRQLNNLSLVLFNNLMLWILFPWVAFDIALWAQAKQLGILTALNPLPIWLEFVVAILLLDMVIYWQHRLFHRVPWLWRLHKVHHSDQEFDTTTALRFHPIEIALSMIIKMVAVVALGVTPLAVLVFETLLNSSAMFNHANLKLPLSADAKLRKLIVTPDMHRVHHSIYRNECNANYGFFLAIWDRLFGSYVAQPKDGHNAMRIGTGDFNAPRDLWLKQLLTQPFRQGE